MVLGEGGLDIGVDEEDARAHVGEQAAEGGGERGLADPALGGQHAELDHCWRSESENSGRAKSKAPSGLRPEGAGKY